MGQLASAVLVVLLGAGAASPSARPEPLLVEWSDHPRDPRAYIEDPVFLRTLFCRDNTARSCELMVVKISRLSDRLYVHASNYRAVDGDLVVSRRGDIVDLEIRDPLSTTKLNIVLMKGRPSQIVKQASGVAISTPVGNERVHAVELVGFVKNSKHADGQSERLAVDLKSSTLSVVAAKSVGE